MSTFEREGYQWRETYFVFFEPERRPTLRQIERALRKLNSRFELLDPAADSEGRFDSLTVVAPDDYAALDISFSSGDEVFEQGVTLQKEFRGAALDPDEKRKLVGLAKLGAKFDLLHFERIAEGFGEQDEPDDMLDPSALLLVMDALVELTGGVGVDPQSGALT